MSQHDQNIANDTGAAVRSDINLALGALFSVSSGASAPATTVAYQFWADTTNGLLKQRNAANTSWLVRGTLAETFVIARSSNTILGVGDLSRIFIATSTFTQTLTAAATLGDGWWCGYRNDGSGVITIDPDVSETIDGGTTITLQPGEACVIYCNGSAFKTIGRRRINDLTEDTTPDVAADYFETWDASAGAHKKVKIGKLPSGLTLIERLTASASAQIDFVNGIDGTYDEYLVTLTNVRPATDGANLLVRISQDGGVSFRATAGDYAHAEETANGGGTGGETGGTNAVGVQIAGPGISNVASSGGLSGEVRFFAPSSAAVHKQFIWSAVASNATDFYSMQGGGRFDLDTQAINAVRFVMSGGNIASGALALYGVRKS